jgi:hypothetical protein
VARLVRQLKVVAGLAWWLAVTTALLPLVSIVVALTLRELQHMAFDLMAEPDGRVSAPAPTPGEDTRTNIVIVLAIASCFLAPWLAMIYAAAVVTREAPDSRHTPT